MRFVRTGTGLVLLLLLPLLPSVRPFGCSPPLHPGVGCSPSTAASSVKKGGGCGFPQGVPGGGPNHLFDPEKEGLFPRSQN